MSVFSASKTFRPVEGFGGFPCLQEGCHLLLICTFLAVSAICLILFGLFERRTSDFFDSRKSALCGGITAFSGSLILLLGGTAGTPAVVVAAFLMGIGGAVFAIIWGNAFTRFDFATAVINSALSIAIGLILAIALVNWVIAPISGIVASLLPILMTAVFWKKHSPALGTSENGIDIKYLRVYMVRFAASMALFGFTLGAMRVFCANQLLSFGELSIQLILGGGCIASIVLFLVTIAFSKKETSWDFLFRVISPFVLIAISCFSLLLGDAVYVAAFFASLGYVSFVALIWIFLSSLSRTMNGSSIFVFGIGYGIMQGLSMFGSIAAYNLAQMIDVLPIEASMYQISQLALLLVVVMSFGYSVQPRYRELKAIISSALRDIVLSHAVEGIEEVESESGKILHIDAIRAKAASLNTEGAQVEPLESEQENLHPELMQEAAPAEEMPEEASIVEEKPREKGSFTRRCEEIAATYKLSGREKEVLFLLAKGHNASYILDKLCISKSTAKTHINHIYKKLDIHTQQELLTMVEDRQRGPLGMSVDRETLREAVRHASEEGPLERDPSLLVEHIQRDAVGR